MSKKAKRSMLASVMSEVVASDSSVSSQVPIEIKTESSVKLQSNEQLGQLNEIKYDDVCDKSEELVRISNQNSELTDKLASYIEELNALKEKYSNLQAEYDNCLIKISTLSFENASLKAQLEKSKLEDSNENLKQCVQQVQIKQSTTVPYMHQMNRNKNGYSDWN